MEKKLYTVTDLGGGDGGKGGVVHRLSSLRDAHTILKVGGAQGSHGVRTSAGQSFNFSQFGCGTFEGTRTHITDLMVIEPYRLLKEGEELIYQWGIRNAFDLITIDENALCITPYHTFASRLQELARKDKPKGTVGIGGGVAVADNEEWPNLSIRAKDLGKSYLRDRLELVRRIKLKALAPIIENVGDLLPTDQESAMELIKLLKDEDLPQRTATQFNVLKDKVKIVDKEYLKRGILGRDGFVVVESSHGILTDRYHGFHPNTSYLRTTLQPTLDLLAECEYDGEIKKLCITRAYQIRHGAGPMVTESDELLGKLLPGSHKDQNRWQGKVRVGALDLVTLRYAIEVCGGPEMFDGLAVTWFDQIKTAGAWNLCTSYIGAEGEEFFSPDGTRIRVRHGSDEAQLEHQRELGKRLTMCRPNLFSTDIRPGDNDRYLAGLCAQTLERELSVPVRMVSFGPTEDDKMLL